MEQIMNNGSTIVGANRLSEAAIAAIANFARLGGADRGAALRMLGITRGGRTWTPRTPGVLPTLTGLVPDRDRRAIYGSKAWAARYRPFSRVVAYVLQSRGLGQLSIEIGGHSTAKVGTASTDNVVRRIADLGAIEYGAWHRGYRRYLKTGGFDVFLPAPRLQLAPQPPLSPVRLTSLGIEVGLPPGMSPEQFEAEFNRRLGPLRLQTVADSDAGRALCAAAGIDPARLRRFYRAGKSYRIATELTFMRPQADAGALAKMCSDIVIDHLLGLLPKRPSR